VRTGERLQIFYTGGGAKADPKKGIPMSIGLATIGLDRFAGMGNWRGGSPGRLATKPLEVSGQRLEINVESLEHLPVRVAVSEPGGAMLPGYSLEESDVPVQRERIYTPVRWKARPDLSELRGKTVSLHFEVRGAILYGYRLARNEPGG
jgi:hypothetical protein